MTEYISNLHTNTQWTSKIEKVLKVIQKQCYIYKISHNNIANKSDKIYSALMITSIVITPLSGIVTTIGTILCDNLNEILYYTMTSTILSFLAGILISITKFSKFDKVSQAHLTAMSRYTSLEDNIKRQLFLDPQERIQAQEYLDWIIKNFDELYTSSPLLLDDNLTKYTNFIDLYESVHDTINIDTPSRLKTNKNTCQDKYQDPIDKINLSNIKMGKNTKEYLFTSHQDLKKYDGEFVNKEIKNLSE